MGTCSITTFIGQRRLMMAPGRSSLKMTAIFTGASPNTLPSATRGASDGLRSDRRRPVFIAAFGKTRGFTLRLPFGSEFRHDEALTHLERVANAFFFDFDMRYGFSIGLAVEQRRWRRSSRRYDGDPEYPANVYAQEPLALLRYGRAASEFPLLEFLAYYQALEYFFPHFSGQAVIQNLRSQLKNPAFDFSSDAAIARIIAVASPAVKSGGSEREQIRETIRAVADQSVIEEYFTEPLRDSVSKKGTGVDYVTPIQFDERAPDLRDQVASRLYEIRCRIVHAKSDGGPNDKPVLLPDSPESHRLEADIGLMRLLAERAVIARARRE